MEPARSMISVGGVACTLWTWTSSDVPRGLAVIFHGLGAHARFPSVRVGAEALAQRGYIVVAPDFPGHGESEGLRGFIYSSDALEEVGLAAVSAAREGRPMLPLFLLGSSMGGAIALQVALKLGDNVSGVVLLAPMLAPAASTSARLLLGVLSYTPLCRLAVIPSSATDNRAQYADPAILSEVERDALAYKGALRLGSAAAVLDLGRRCESSCEELAAPFLCITAEREQILGPAAREAAARVGKLAASGGEKVLRLHRSYDALHGLLCEPEPLRSQIVDEIVAFLTSCAAQASSTGTGADRAGDAA